MYFKLADIVRGNQAKNSNLWAKKAKSDHVSQSVRGYKWSQKVVIFGKVKEKGNYDKGLRFVVIDT